VIDYIAWLRMTPVELQHQRSDHRQSAGAQYRDRRIAEAPSGRDDQIHAAADELLARALIDSMLVRVVQNPSDLLRRFEPTGEKFVIGARISGPAKTAFPNGRAQRTTQAAGGTGRSPQARCRRAAAQVKDAKDINVVVVADSDLFDDRFWVQVQSPARSARRHAVGRQWRAGDECGGEHDGLQRADFAAHARTFRPALRGGRPDFAAMRKGASLPSSRR